MDYLYYSLITITIVLILALASRFRYQLRSIFSHIGDWSEGYVAIPFSALIAVPATAWLIWTLTGRRTLEDPNEIMAFVLKMVGAFIVLFYVTFFHQKTSWFIPKDQQGNLWKLAIAHEVKFVAVLWIVLWYITK